MKTISTAIVALALSASALAQSSITEGVTATPTGPVVQITFPGGVDSQILVASLVGTASHLTTLVVGCPDGTDQNDCGFEPPITITAGSTSIKFGLDVIDGEPPYTEDCSFNSNGGVCTVTGTADTDTSGGSTVITTTSSLDASDIMTVPITITAGATAGLTGGSGSASSTKPSSTKAGSSTTSSVSKSGSSQSSTSTSSSNDAELLVPGTFGAALMGLAAIYL